MVAGEDDRAVQNEIAIDQFVEVVGVVVQGEHVVESGLEVVVEEVVEKEMGVIVAM